MLNPGIQKTHPDSSVVVLGSRIVMSTSCHAEPNHHTCICQYSAHTCLARKHRCLCMEPNQECHAFDQDHVCICHNNDQQKDKKLPPRECLVENARHQCLCLDIKRKCRKIGKHMCCCEEIVNLAHLVCNAPNNAHQCICTISVAKCRVGIDGYHECMCDEYDSESKSLCRAEYHD